MINTNSNNTVNARDVYSFVGVKTRFTDWIKRCIDYADLIEGKDFYSKLSIGKRGGRPETDYELTIDAAKEVCIVSATTKAKDLRRWLIGLSSQVESGELLTHDEVVKLSELKSVFLYIDNCEAAEKYHMKKFVEDSTSKNPYPEFHIMRNKLLNLEPDVLDKRIKEWCIENSRMVTPKNKRDALAILDKYEILRNGIWDFLKGINNEKAMNLANLAKKMAIAEGQLVLKKNEEDLFFKQQQLPVNVMSKLLS